MRKVGKRLRAWRLIGGLAAVEEAGKGREDVRRLMTHPRVGRIVALAFALTVGPVHRFPNRKHLVSYLGLNPAEHSSGGRQKFGRISKQGNRLMRSLLVEAARQQLVSNAASGSCSSNSVSAIFLCPAASSTNGL